MKRKSILKSAGLFFLACSIVIGLTNCTTSSVPSARESVERQQRQQIELLSRNSATDNPEGELDININNRKDDNDNERFASNQLKSIYAKVTPDFQVKKMKEIKVDSISHFGSSEAMNTKYIYINANSIKDLQGWSEERRKRAVEFQIHSISIDSGKIEKIWELPANSQVPDKNGLVEEIRDVLANEDWIVWTVVKSVDSMTNGPLIPTSDDFRYPWAIYRCKVGQVPCKAELVDSDNVGKTGVTLNSVWRDWILYTKYNMTSSSAGPAYPGEVVINQVTHPMARILDKSPSAIFTGFTSAGLPITFSNYNSVKDINDDYWNPPQAYVFDPNNKWKKIKVFQGLSYDLPIDWAEVGDTITWTEDVRTRDNGESPSNWDLRSVYLLKDKQQHTAQQSGGLTFDKINGRYFSTLSTEGAFVVDSLSNAAYRIQDIQPSKNWPSAPGGFGSNMNGQFYYYFPDDNFNPVGPWYLKSGKFVIYQVFPAKSTAPSNSGK